MYEAHAQEMLITNHRASGFRISNAETAFVQEELAEVVAARHLRKCCCPGIEYV